MKWQGKHYWRNKLWRIDSKSLIKRILKQFEYTSAPILSIHSRVCACLLNDVSVSVKYFPRLLEINSTGKEPEEELIFGTPSKLHCSPSL